MSMGAFGNHTQSDLSGFFSDDSSLISEKNQLRSLRMRLPNAPYIWPYVAVLQQLIYASKPNPNLTNY